MVRGETYPRFPADFDRASACALQDALVQRVCQARNSAIAGFKAGVTSAKVQRALGLDSPLLGQLYADGHYQVGSVLPFHPQRLIECEIAIVVNTSGAPTGLAAAMEFVVPGFAEVADNTANNLIAANLVAEGFMLGPIQAWPDPEQLLGDTEPRFSLSRGSEPLNSGLAFESLDGPDRALQWMLAEAEQRALPLAEGMILLTGNCGAPVPAEPGLYRADYGVLGAFEFRIGEPS